MCEVLVKILTFFKPMINDVDNCKTILDTEHQKCNRINELMFFIKDDPTGIIEFKDQDEIIEILKRNNFNINEYKAMAYILKPKKKYMTGLPQFSDAVFYFNQLYDSLIIYSEAVRFHIDVLENDLEKLLLLQKYDEIFNKQDIYVENINELDKYLSYITLSEEEKVSLYQFIVKENVKYYTKNGSNRVTIDKEDNNQDLVKLHELIHNNSNLLQKENMNICHKVSNYVNLSENLADIINDDVLAYVDINEIIIAKQVWLMRRIKTNYKSCGFGKVSKFVKEYEYIESLKNKLKGVSSYQKIMRIIKEGC